MDTQRSKTEVSAVRDWIRVLKEVGYLAAANLVLLRTVERIAAAQPPGLLLFDHAGKRCHIERLCYVNFAAARPRQPKKQQYAANDMSYWKQSQHLSFEPDNELKAPSSGTTQLAYSALSGPVAACFHRTP
ncbi:hypothetical protein SNOG_03394 [Parastagonospora nodorum SN15]|uniref:Uncharacterized protein n=1 Tax=Phaeosphaeria nodorum (strain SN15 / ATCC MYA-4574 / FGSC 10173) TaxID=321614 RepID=Q0UXX0_PHANO|nr:hypothetical protein SNOG_03394 [Parastagonospora nodorum SN15]EAT88599.1 hypothetical protein SNOG_03394 [Parastagonospora nodorum SN15]